MLSFRNRLLILLIGLVVGAEIVTLFTALASTGATERRRADQQLLNGAHIAESWLANRQRELANAVAVVTKDDALRVAVGERHGPTVESVLLNHGGRVGATLSLALDPGGGVIARGDGAPTDPDVVAAIDAAIDGIGDDAGSALYVTTARGVHQVFVSPVLDGIAYVALGFSVDSGLARELEDLLDAEVAFLTGMEQGQVVVASTLEELHRTPVAGGLVARERPTEVTVGKEKFLAAVTQLSAQSPQLQLALLKPMSEVMAPFRHLALMLSLIIGITLAAAVVAGVYMGRSAARPVQQLADGAARVAAGDYSQPVRGSGGRELAHLAEAFNSMQRGIADRETRLLHVARHDGATGLPNRYFAEQWLGENLRGMPRGRMLGLALVRVTNLREVSASLGFEIAEQLIRHVARCFADWRGTDGFVARVDAEHFLIATPCEELVEMRRLLEVARAKARTPLDTAGVTLQAAVIIGAAIAPHDGGSANELLRCAEAAVEMAAAQGLPHAWFEHANDEAQRRRLKLGADLPAALEADQLYLRFQPKFRLRDRRPVGVEALVRWQHPEFGEVSPVEFIPIAERTGASGPLTRWVLHKALAQLAAWHAAGIQVGMAVNLSAADILDPDLLRYIMGSLRDARLAPGALTLEITESVLLNEPDAARRNIEMLRIAGVRFAIDDFGTGYSSLSQLRALAADELKIDQSFVRALPQGPEHAAVIRAIVELGHGLGLAIVGEGVESEEQWRLLAELGCEHAQGYLTGTPQLAAELTPQLLAAAADMDPEPITRTASLRVLELRRKD